MSIADDLAILEQQEHVLRFSSFNTETAWQLGCLLRTLLLDCRAGGTVEIELAGHVLFACATPTATPGQADWIRRKRNVVHRFGRSSYAIGLTLESNNETLQSRHCLKASEYAAHGGGFPILLEGTGPVGSVVVSGLPQRDDHNLVISALAKLLEKDVPRLS
ncbi:MAG TPA: heme-degrading domain-containing protein [Candidatus Aquilonibacter sp.]|nr:heme-degrading domain-containing protein [Candidatus Aquilonibacter sp.]